MKKEEIVFIAEETLEKLEFWKPIYKTLLKTCKSKKEALDALKYLISMDIQ